MPWALPWALSWALPWALPWALQWAMPWALQWALPWAPAPCRLPALPLQLTPLSLLPVRCKAPYRAHRRSSPCAPYRAHHARTWLPPPRLPPL